MEISEKLIEFAKNHAYPTADVKDVNMISFVVDPDLGLAVDLNGNVLYAEDILEAAIAKRLCILVDQDDAIMASYDTCVHITEDYVVAVFAAETDVGVVSLQPVTFPYRPTEPEEEDGD